VTDTQPPPAPGLLASDLDLLAEPLRDRAVELRRYLSWARTSGAADPAARVAVADQLSLALDAAFAGDQAAAQACIDVAEMAAGPWREQRAARHAAAMAEQNAEAMTKAERRMRKLRARVSAEGGAQPVTDTVALIGAGMSGRVPVADPDPYLVIATDGSYAKKYYGWAYLASDGRWGARGGLGGADPSGALIAELAGVGMGASWAAGGRPGMVLLAVDSRAALDWVTRWRAGDEELPAVEGDTAQDQRRRAWVAAAAGDIRRRPGLAAVHVPGHRGHHLNEAADMLAKMARRWRAGEDQATPEQMNTRIEAVCSTFLRSWYGQ